jgi:hypothetical protein
MFIAHLTDATRQADGQSDLRYSTSITRSVDLNGVNELSAELYDASGVRLSTVGYRPPPQREDG